MSAMDPQIRVSLKISFERVNDDLKEKVAAYVKMLHKHLPRLASGLSHPNT
jgi:hypothetical protein